MIRAEIRVDNNAEILLGTVPVEQYGVDNQKIIFELRGLPGWIEGNMPPPATIELEWGNYSADGLSMLPAIKAKANEIDKLRRIDGFIEGPNR